MSSNLPSSDEEEIRNSARLSAREEDNIGEFSSEIFIPTDSAINTASSNSTSQQISISASDHADDSAIGHPVTSTQEKTNRLVHELLSDPQKVASTDFNDLVSTLTKSLNKLSGTSEIPGTFKAKLDQTTEDRRIGRGRTDSTTNPFHPLYSPHTTTKVKRPILPLEGGNEDDAPILRPPVPRLEALNSSVFDIKRPTDVLVGLSQHNPFRLEAWNEGKDHQTASTARPYSGTKTHENLQHFDPGLAYNGDDEHERDDQSKNTDYEDDFEVEHPVRLSSSLPNSTRRPAPCAISYPSTSVFIRLVNSAFEAGLTSPSKFYLDGCCDLVSNVFDRQAV